jgi:hypothetical protein
MVVGERPRWEASRLRFMGCDFFAPLFLSLPSTFGEWLEVFVFLGEVLAFLCSSELGMDLPIRAM